MIIELIITTVFLIGTLASLIQLLWAIEKFKE